MLCFSFSRWLSGIVSALTVIGLTACGPRVSVTPMVETQVAQTPSTEAAQEIGTPTSAPIDLSVGSGSFNLPAPAIGLTSLTSYRATLVRTFEGTQDGEPEQWTRTYILLSSQDPAARQITVDAVIAPPLDEDASVSLLLVEAGGMVFEQRDMDSCTPYLPQGDEPPLAQWEPALFLPSVFGAEEVGSEPIDGIPATQYRFDGQALALTEPVEASGDLWMTADGSYVLRYVLNIQGGEEIFGEGGSGSMTWEYTLADVNQPITIAPPDGCATAMVDAPRMPEGVNMIELPGITSYELTGVTVEAVLTYYQDQLPALGWTLASEPVFDDTMGTAIFTQAEQAMAVIVRINEGQAVVRLVLNDEFADGPLPTP